MFGDPIADIDDPTLVKFIQTVHRYTGITLAKNRKAMLQGRIRPRLRALKLATYAEYLDFLESNVTEKQVFIDAMTTNETYFYRTPRIWMHIESEFLPNWFAKNPKVIFQAWSAAASTGEEAHTLAMILQQFKEKHPSFDYQIFATDISKDVLAVGERGVYTGRPIDLLRKNHPSLFQKFLKETTPENFSFANEVHSKIKFQLYNLFDKPLVTKKYDLVLIRNVLIYFELSDQERVLSNIHKTMKLTSTLIIGESESLTRLTTPFSYESPLIYTTAASAAPPKARESA
jgi:chemotaxis protein methyltransferase CheR